MSIIMGVYDHAVRIGWGGRVGPGGLAAAVLVSALVLLAPAAVAGAEVLPATCSNLQSRITSLGKQLGHGEGDTIVLSGMCDEEALGFATGVTIPEGVYLTLEGAAGTTSGLDGTGVTGTLLSTVENPSQDGTVTLSHLTFQHATHGAVSLTADRVALEADSFLEDSNGNRPGAAYIVPGIGHCPASGQSAATILDSSFHSDSSAVEGGEGGAVSIFTPCEGNPIAIEGSVFEDNLLHASEPFTSAGGALAVYSETEPPAALEQRGNVFAGNRVEGPAGGSYGGGGEWLEGVDLASVGDRFSANTISGTEGKAWSWGAGLGILSCNASTPTQSTLEDDVLEGNSIAGGEAEDAGGAAIYVGCTSTAANYVTLLDSTVAENSVPNGGTAGIDGDTNDHLTVENSILAEDIGGEEIKGFSGAGGTLAASFSDVCDDAGTAPLTGEGNICANPLLADNGNPASFDVHETQASPTINAGSNALVPSGLTTDFYGEPRIYTRSVSTCGPGATTVAIQLYPATVDVGAGEYTPTIPVTGVSVPPCLPARLVVPGISASIFSFPSVAVHKSGLLALSFANLTDGRLQVLGTFKVTRTVLRRVEGRRRHVKKLETIVYGRASYAVVSPGNVKLELKPTKRALALLARRKHLRVLLSITFTGTDEAPTTHSRTIAVPYIKPHHRHRG
jgi:hypothetical protein